MANSLDMQFQFFHGHYRIDQVRGIIPVCPSTWWAGVKSGRFPSPVNLGLRITVWKKSDIHILQSKIIHGELG